MFKYILIFTFFTSSAFSKPVTHRVQWEKGVYSGTVSKWTSSLEKVSNVSSFTYIKKKYGGKDRLHKVKHRDVIVWIPETTDITKDLTMIIWFHGHYGYVQKRTFENRTLEQFVPFTNSKNFILVIPEMPWSVHTKTPSKRNSLLWQKPGDFIGFLDSIKLVLLSHLVEENKNEPSTKKRVGKIDYRIVGHSAGGSTIKRIGITGDLCKIKPSLIVWSDSSYGKWLRDSWNGCLALHRNIRIKVFVHKGGWPWRRGLEFMKEFNNPSNVELYIKSKGWSHKLIGDNIVKLSDILD